MHYSIRHKTRFRYSAQISESFTELRMQPRTEGIQRCLDFSITTSPAARVLHHRDALGNIVHHFDIPAPHKLLTITAQAHVVFAAPVAIPTSLEPATWDILNSQVHQVEMYDFLAPSQFAAPTPLLDQFAREIDARQRDDPLTVLRQINSAIYRTFDYAPQSTRVDSPISEALQARKGVCQDFAHIMTTLVRQLNIPCRYVSGYLFHRTEDHDRSAEDATHAWVEAWLPDLGWVGFDPTNNLVVGDRHIRVAVGRDYADVPPTKGVYRGDATNSIEVGVRVVPTEAPVEEEPELVFAGAQQPIRDDDAYQEQQQQ
jgi:transglutaminase-like putative cysteine protease